MIINLKKSLAGVLAAALTLSSVPFFGVKTVSNAPAFSVTAEENQTRDVTQISDCIYYKDEVFYKDSNYTTEFTELEDAGITYDPQYKMIVFDNVNLETSNAKFLHFYSDNAFIIRLKGTNKITCTAEKNAVYNPDNGTVVTNRYLIQNGTIEIRGDENSSLEIVNTADDTVRIRSTLDLRTNVTFNFKADAQVTGLNLYKGSKLTMINLPTFKLNVGNNITAPDKYSLTGGKCYKLNVANWNEIPFTSGQVNKIESSLTEGGTMVLADMSGEPSYVTMRSEINAETGKDDFWIYFYCPESISNPQVTIKRKANYSDRTETIEYKNLEVEEASLDNSIATHRVKFNVAIKEYYDNFEIYVNNKNITPTDNFNTQKAFLLDENFMTDLADVAAFAMTYFNYNIPHEMAKSCESLFTDNNYYNRLADEIEQKSGEKIKNATDSQNYIGSTLLLNHEVTLCHYFTTDTDFTVIDNSGKIKVEDVEIDGSTFKVLKLCDVTPAKYGDVTEITHKYNDGTECYVRFSILEYIYWILRNYEDNEPNLVKICEMLYGYNKSVLKNA